MNLGRNILQADEGGSRSATGFLERLAQDELLWPLGVVRGVALEPFTNENHEIRTKGRRLDLVLSALVQLGDASRDDVIAQIVASVEAGTPRRWVLWDDFASVLESLKARQWAEPLVRSLEAKLPREG